jgi:DNA-binding response OmpR family regulator
MKILLILNPAGRAGEQLQSAAELSGWEVTRITRWTEAEQAILSGTPEGIIFEENVIDEGFIARVGRDHPLLVRVAWISAPSSQQVADLFSKGVDEVINPTMGTREVISRIEKRVQSARGMTSQQLTLGPLMIDLNHGEVLWDGMELSLSPRERALLAVLTESAGHTIRRDMIYQRVWGYTMARGDRSVDVNIKRLRGKLAASGVGVEIRTQAGVGYRLDLAESSVAEM